VAIDPHETARILARDLAPVVSELASLKGEVYRDLGSRPEHRALAHRLEAAHAAAEAALVEAKRRVRLDEGRLASAADRKSGAVPKTGNADTHHLMGANRRAGPP
jgi:hypothetical protein